MSDPTAFATVSRDTLAHMLQVYQPGLEQPSLERQPLEVQKIPIAAINSMCFLDNAGVPAFHVPVTDPVTETECMLPREEGNPCHRSACVESGAPGMALHEELGQRPNLLPRQILRGPFILTMPDRAMEPCIPQYLAPNSESSVLNVHHARRLVGYRVFDAVDLAGRSA